LRSAGIVLLVFAVADAQWVRASDRLTVIYLLDQSLSIPREQREAMIEHVNQTVEQHLRNRDRAGVIVFGRDASIEIPPLDRKVHISGRIESTLDPENTNLAGAMRLAQATFPEDAAKRVVIVSDGNENLGDALKQARLVAGAGVGIDVVPVRYDNRADVVLRRLSVPGNLRPGQPFDLRIVVENTTRPTAGRSEGIAGRLVVSRRTGNQSDELANMCVVLPPGKRVFAIRQQGELPGSYRYEARFLPDRPEDDWMARNNRATAITHVRGKGQVLLIEDYANRGEFDFFVERLRKQDLEVTVRPSNRLFAEFDELQPYDTVLLANVPREQFTDAQIEMLARNTQQLGAGLVMLGGANSFGSGGWTNTLVEQAMPVDFQIQNLKVVPSGALALVIDRSGSMSGEKLEACKAAAIASIKTLGWQDFVGVVEFDSDAQWIVHMTRARNFPAVARRIQNIGVGGGTNMYPGMRFGYKGLKNVEASVKHMVVLSDGQTEGKQESYETLAGQIGRDKITISTVAVGAGANETLLERIATIGHGKFHRVNNPRTLPRIFMEEARRIARPLIYESEKGVRPVVKYGHDAVRGIEGPLPPIHGFVMTTVKDNPLVEVSLVSPVPSDQRNSTILAGWTYGLGRAVALTTDVGARWAADWTAWQDYDKLFGQIVRWSMRPFGANERFTVNTRVEDNQAEVILTALDKDELFVNFLNVGAIAIGPELESIDVKIEQTAPGRYVGHFPVDKVGSYFLSITPGIGEAPIQTGLNVSYSREFRDRATNEPLLDQMAAMVPTGGAAGVVIEADKGSHEAQRPFAVDTFRHDLKKATCNQEVWHYLALLAGCLFFFDVLVRRVQVNFAWVGPALAKMGNLVRRRRPEVALPETIDRLRNRKAEVESHLQQMRDEADAQPTARFEASGEMPDGAGPLQELTGPRQGKRLEKQVKSSIASERPAEDETYTERLLRAKKKVWQERGKKP
ncbi:MAG: VWA domain-containing protein, partial [Pirellulales bacterium]|nr:VWA domain-containing protein [Pirellulales bacterium]